MAVLEEIEDEPPAREEAPAAAAPAGASDSDSDDEPPPLESAAAQLEALNLRRRVAERVNAARADSGAPSESASTGAARASSLERPSWPVACGTWCAIVAPKLPKGKQATNLLSSCGQSFL